MLYYITATHHVECGESILIVRVSCFLYESVTTNPTYVSVMLSTVTVSVLDYAVYWRVGSSYTVIEYCIVGVNE